MITLTVVGCAGSASGPDGPASSYLVRAPDPTTGEPFDLVVDLGPGAFGALYRYVDPARIGALGLTHLHADHCIDVCSLYVAARYSGARPWPALPLFGPTGTVERLARAYRVAAVEGDPGRPSEPDGFAEQFIARRWSDEPAGGHPVGPFVITSTRVEHPVETYAMRITEAATGANLTYSADTGASEALVQLAQGTDLLLCEAAFGAAGSDRARPAGLHLTAAEAAEHATRADARALMITHIPPWEDAEGALAVASAAFAGGPTLLARPGGEWTVG